MENPKNVFISYSHSDRGVAEKIARFLHSKGVEAFFDQWDIKPGDSLIQKIFSEGLSKAQFFIILLSKQSVSSKWVKDELDAAMVQKIKGILKIIPILIEETEIPMSLRSVRWIDMTKNDEEGLNELVNSIYGITERPPIEEAPRYVNDLHSSVQGLSKIASTIAKLLIDNEENNLKYEREYENKFIKENIPFLTIEQINDGVAELEEFGLIKVRRYMGVAPYEFYSLTPTYNLFLTFEDEITNFKPSDDIKTIAALINARKRCTGKEIEEITKIPSLRINRAIDYLDDSGLVDVLRALGTAPYDFFDVNRNHKTSRILES